MKKIITLIIALVLFSCEKPEATDTLNFSEFINGLTEVTDRAILADLLNVANTKCDCTWSGSTNGVDYTVTGVGGSYYISTGGGLWSEVLLLDLQLFGLLPEE